MGVEPKIRGFTPNHPFVYRVFPLFSPSILGYPYFWKHPNGWRIKVGKRSTSIRRSHVFFFFYQDVDDASMEIADAKLPYGYEPRAEQKSLGKCETTMALGQVVNSRNLGE